MIKNGLPFNKYEVVCSESTPKGISSDCYYFNNKRDAEIYILYLYQLEGVKDIERLLHSNRTHLWEKREFEEFLATLDLEKLPNRVKKIQFTTEHHFVEKLPRKKFVDPNLI